MSLDFVRILFVNTEQIPKLSDYINNISKVGRLILVTLRLKFN